MFIAAVELKSTWQATLTTAGPAATPYLQIRGWFADKVLLRGTLMLQATSLKISQHPQPRAAHAQPGMGPLVAPPAVIMKGVLHNLGVGATLYMLLRGVIFPVAGILSFPHNVDGGRVYDTQSCDFNT